MQRARLRADTPHMRTLRTLVVGPSYPQLEKADALYWMIRGATRFGICFVAVLSLGWLGLLRA